MQIIAKRAVAALAVCLTVAACSETVPGSDRSLEEPNMFSMMTMDEEVLAGRYNAQGYSAAKVKSLIRHLCISKRLASYGEEDAAGLIAFRATCKGGTMNEAGATIFTRQDNRKIIVKNVEIDAQGLLTVTKFELN